MKQKQNSFKLESKPSSDERLDVPKQVLVVEGQVLADHNPLAARGSHALSARELSSAESEDMIVRN